MKLWYLIGFLALGGTLCAQLPAPTELLRIDNAFERKAFEQLQQRDTNHLALLLAASGEMDSLRFQKYRNQLDLIFKELDSARLVRKKPSKQIEKLFESVHDELLVKYEFENQFVEIFERGYYNCVSATAVYSYMLGRMGIKHVIIETPDHVYAAANLQGEEWIMESTDPVQGFYEITEKDRERELDRLVEQKIITREQRFSDKLDSILQHLYPSDGISGSRLVSLQYLNQALYDLEDEKRWEGFQNSLKAYLLAPGEKQSLLLQESLGIWLAEEKIDNPVYYRAIAFFIGNDSSASHRKKVLEAFPYYGQLYLQDTLTPGQFDSITTAYQRGLYADPAGLGEIAVYSRLFKAQKRLDGGDAVAAYPFGRQAVLLDPQLKDARDQIMGVMGRIIVEQSWSNANILDSLRSLHSQVPLLRDEQLWNGIYGETILQEIFLLLDQNRLGAARKLRREFEKMMDDPALDAVVTKSLIGAVYARLALKDYNISKAAAAKTIRKGLEYAPMSSDLLRYKKMMRI